MDRALLHKMVAETCPGVDASTVTLEDGKPLLQTPLRAAEVAAAALGAQAAMVCEIWRRRTGRPQTAKLSMEGAALSLQSVHQEQVWDKYTIKQTEPSYPTVDIYPTQDKKFVMINGGYPGLRDSLLLMLDRPNDRERISEAIAHRNAEALELEAGKQKLCAVMVRTEQEWEQHEQGKALARQPAVKITKIADGDRVPFPPLRLTGIATELRPLSGLKVLDLTHVIAGPTCAKTLAEQGATVLHITSPKREQLPPFDVDTGHGKLSAFLDLSIDEDKRTLRKLVEEADVFSQSYRPGGMDALGFSPQELSALRPGIVVVSFSCYGSEGPMSSWHGFEQLAQSATGMATVQAWPDGRPRIELGFFPNDYITGFLAALGTLAALIRREREGGSYHVEVSLCRYCHADTRTGSPAGPDHRRDT